MKTIANATLRKLAGLPVLAAAASLTACYVVPVDPRTGLPYPVPQTSQQIPGDATAPIAISRNTILQTRLYPLNDEARRAGVLIATATDSDNGRGTFSVTFLGERLTGDASRVDGSYPGFGRIYREVLGAGGDAGKGGRRGIANGFGSGGTGVQCEYHMTSKDVGTGVCLFSNGAKYQMHFGA